jgi:hypothetical protein
VSACIGHASEYGARKGSRAWFSPISYRKGSLDLFRKWAKQMLVTVVWTKISDIVIAYSSLNYCSGIVLGWYVCLHQSLRKVIDVCIGRMETKVVYQEQW